MMSYKWYLMVLGQYKLVLLDIRWYMVSKGLVCLYISETSEILVSREFSSNFFSFLLLVLDLEPFQFHFHFSKKSEGILFFTSRKSESYRYFTLFSRKKVKLGPRYNLTSIFVPNCISKDSQISSKHKPQNIGQISVLKS